MAHTPLDLVKNSTLRGYIDSSGHNIHPCPTL